MHEVERFCRRVKCWRLPSDDVDVHFQATGQRSEGELSQLEDTVHRRLPSTRERPFVEEKPIPLRLPEQSPYTTHRTVTPVLPEPEKTSCSAPGSEWDSLSRRGQSCELFAPMPTQFLVPPDYEAVFSGHQTLRVSDALRASNDPVLVRILPGASIQKGRHTPEVLSETEEPLEDLPKPLQKEAASPGLSDSDLEFFDCRQGFSDSDPEDVGLQRLARCPISEPPSPVPGSALLLRYHSEADAPAYEELPSRDQAGYCDDDDDGEDDDDVLGRVSGGA